MTENGGDIFVKENPKVEGAQKMFDGEFCSLQVIETIITKLAQFNPYSFRHFGLQELSGFPNQYKFCRGIHID